MSKNTVTLLRSHYRWFVALFPILALLLSACGTGSNGGGFSY